MFNYKYILCLLLAFSACISAISKKQRAFIEYLEKNEIVGWGYGLYYHVLPEIIKENNLKVGCEVGVSCGLHAYAILKNSNLLKLYCVDPYLQYGDPTNANMQQKVWDFLFYKVVNRLSVFKDRADVIREKSIDAANKFKNHELDFVFLDANHTYKEVKKDLAIWFDKIKLGGFFIGDDYETIWPGVKKAVDEFFKEKKLKVNQYNSAKRIWWVKKI